jgi:hypothetical protein
MLRIAFRVTAKKLFQVSSFKIQANNARFFSSTLGGRTKAIIGSTAVSLLLGGSATGSAVLCASADQKVANAEAAKEAEMGTICLLHYCRSVVTLSFQETNSSI